MAITKKDTALIWELITAAQHTAWIEGHAMGEDGGERNRNPYPLPLDADNTLALYRLMKGQTNA